MYIIDYGGTSSYNIHYILIEIVNNSCYPIS